MTKTATPPAPPAIDLARVGLRYEWRTGLEEEEFEGAELVQQWHVTASLHDDDGELLADSIGNWRLRIFPGLAVDDPAEYLDSLSGDDAEFGCLFDGDHIRDSLVMAPSGGDVMIVDSAVLDEEYRGQGLGAILTAEVIKKLSRHVELVAWQPYPLGAEGSATVEQVGNAVIEHYGNPTPAQQKVINAGKRKIQQVWSVFGGRKVRGDVWALDLTTQATIDLFDKMHEDYETAYRTAHPYGDY